MRAQFKLGKDSFGEAYHLLAAAFLLLQRRGEEIAIKFENPAGEDLFDFLKVRRAIYDPQVGHWRLPLTANIIFEYFHPRCLNPLACRIRKVAQKECWSFPCPQLATTNPKLLIWHRSKDYKKHRNSSKGLLEQLVELCARHKTDPLVIGRCLPTLPPGVVKLGEFYTHDFFKVNSIVNSIPKQLWFLDTLFRCHKAIANVGMMSGAMDGPTMLFGHKTVFLARHSDATPRMRKVSMAVPNLIWQQIEYEDHFQKLTDAQLQDLERNLWA